MPLYEYRCGKCRLQFEAYKRPSEDPAQETCPDCGGKAGKVEISLVASAGSGGASAKGKDACGGGAGRSPFR